MANVAIYSVPDGTPASVETSRAALLVARGTWSYSPITVDPGAVARDQFLTSIKGPAGPAGSPGAPGAVGTTGPAGAANLMVTQGTTNGAGTVQISKPAAPWVLLATVVTGYEANGVTPSSTLYFAEPLSDGAGAGAYVLAQIYSTGSWGQPSAPGVKVNFIFGHD